VVWTLLDTGLRVSELASLRKDNFYWQNHRLMVYGKDGPYGSRSRRRLIPPSARVQPLLARHFALYDTFGMTPARCCAWSRAWLTGRTSAGR